MHIDIFAHAEYYRNFALLLQLVRAKLVEQLQHSLSHASGKALESLLQEIYSIHREMLRSR